MIQWAMHAADIVCYQRHVVEEPAAALCAQEMEACCSDIVHAGSTDCQMAEITLHTL